MWLIKIAAVILAALTLVCCSSPPNTQSPLERAEMVGVWLTYSEIGSMVLSENGFEAEFSQAAENMKEIGINTLFFHTVAFCDSIYPSAIYPFSEALSETRADILKIAVRIAHENGIKIHAWLNPYRVSTKTNELSGLSLDYSASAIAECFNGEHICFTESGIYLNPASSLVRSNITSAVREIINGYEVDGIHFDDYFYPTTDAHFDKESYQEYLKQANTPLTLEEWRRVNVNSLVMGVYSAVKAKDDELLFGISPAADLDTNYNTLFADIEGWLGGGYIDYVIPQLYFGFRYPTEKFRFENLLTNWLDLSGGKADLYIGLAAYKAGTEAVPDNAEWQTDNTIIARQIELIRQNDVGGFVFFSYSSLISQSPYNTEQIKYIKEVL